MSRVDRTRRKAVLMGCFAAACCMVIAAGATAGDRASSTSESAKGLIVFDPGKGKLVDIHEAAKAGRMELPPGRLEGHVRDFDGAPHKGILVALLDSNGAGRLRSLRTGLEGGFSFAGVKPGTYFVHVGSPGVVAPVKVTPKAKAGVLDMRVPTALTLPTIQVPSWMPQWFHSHPIFFTGAVIGGGAMAGTAGWYYLDEKPDRRDHDHKRVSPICP